MQENIDPLAKLKKIQHFRSIQSNLGLLLVKLWLSLIASCSIFDNNDLFIATINSNIIITLRNKNTSS